jgi:hypothetical protein
VIVTSVVLTFVDRGGGGATFMDSTLKRNYRST